MPEQFLGYVVVISGVIRPLIWVVVIVTLLGFRVRTYFLGEFGVAVVNPMGPCTQTVYTLALKNSLYRCIGPKVYTFWVHGALGEPGATLVGVRAPRSN